MCGKELMVYSKRLQSILERECFTHRGGGGAGRANVQDHSHLAIPVSKLMSNVLMCCLGEDKGQLVD